MTILPKKKASAAKNSESESVGELHGQASEPHDRLFVSGGVVSAEELRWAGHGSPRPLAGPGPGSPPRWPPPQASSSEKRLSPHHQLDYDDTLDGAPSTKRSRHTYGYPSRVPSPPVTGELGEGEEDEGNNSEDEYSHVGQNLTEEEWREKDARFERNMRRKGYVIKKMGEDGACLFRAVADQLYGDEEMHQGVRTQCMDYIEGNADYFSQYMTENFSDYVRRKRRDHVHGNHLEIQALAEMYCRPIHIYCYSSEPINIFQHIPQSESEVSIPMRLCYHRGVHYNSLVDPNNASLGMGLGLPGLKPGINDKNTVREALKKSDNKLTEQMMIEDKLKATDWEATDTAVAEQVARESYLQWLADQEKSRRSGRPPPAATVTSGQISPRGAAPAPAASATCTSGHVSPRGSSSPRPRPGTAGNSPKAGCSYHQAEGSSQGRDSPKPGSSRGQASATPAAASAGLRPSQDHGLGPGFHLRETASFLNGLPPDLFGLDDWGEDAVLHQVLAASQQEYLESLKKRDSDETLKSGKETERKKEDQEGGE